MSNISRVAFSPDGKILATGGQGWGLTLWDADTGQQKAVLQGDLGHHYWLSALAFSLDGKTLAAGGTYGTLQLWDMASGKLRASLTGLADEILSLAFSPDGASLASGSGGVVKLWDAHTGQESLALHRPHGVGALAFSPDGKILATGDGGGTARLWHAATDKAATSRRTDLAGTNRDPDSAK
jgi:WD40 repeat protein